MRTPIASRRCVAALVAAALVVPSAARADQAPPTRYRELALELFRELIEIDTTDSTGDNTAAAQAMASHLRAAGFAEEDVRVLGEVPRKGNLVARLRGRDSGRRPILLLAHLDVVEADPADWSVEPFEFLERDGFYWGRGTTDDKDECAIHVANLIRLKEEGFVPDRDIVVALTADEEGGDHNGVVWLLAEHRDLIDAEFALNEGGGGALQNGVRVSNGVQASEKIYQSFALEVTNPGGHSSLPVKDNAITQLSQALVRIAAYDFPVVLNEVTRTFFERSAALAEPEIAAAMRGILRDPPDPASVPADARGAGGDRARQRGDLARRPGHPDHEHGRDRRPLPAQRGYPRLRSVRHLRRRRRHPGPRSGRAHRHALLRRGPGVPLPPGRSAHVANTLMVYKGESA